MRLILKKTLGRIPAAATWYDSLRPIRPRTRYNLEQLAAHLPQAVEQVKPLLERTTPRKKLLLFATLHYWIEQAVFVGLVLQGIGHKVTIAYLPYSNWEKEINGFDLRRQDLYTRRVHIPLNGLIRFISLLDIKPAAALHQDLEIAITTASEYDVMYSLQTEDIDRTSDLYKLRMERNRFACSAAMPLLETERPEAVLIPNGLVTELGVFYSTARHLGIPTITYEFNDQREQIWLAQNDVVMHQNTDDLWKARAGCSLTSEQREKIAALEEARSNAGKYGKGTRTWQDTATEGGERLRSRLKLDKRPVVVLPTNVLGDSLTLGRNLFAESMAEWIRRTVQYFARRSDAELIVRVHPGERLIKRPSMMGVLANALPTHPNHIHVIGPTEPTNTYDLIELADVGLAYTTTVGMEMTMRGIPIIVAGETHYRGRGFTLDPQSWDEYFAMLEDVLKNPTSHRLSGDQLEAAWNYAYRFFFEYPFDFPWRLMHFWKDVDLWPIGKVLSDEGWTAFGRTFDYLAGEPIAW